MGAQDNKMSERFRRRIRWNNPNYFSLIGSNQAPVFSPTIYADGRDRWKLGKGKENQKTHLFRATYFFTVHITIQIVYNRLE